MRSVMTNNDDLGRWLEEHTWFEDALVVALDPSPAIADRPDSLRLLLAEQLEGDYLAGSERRLRDYAITAEGVRKTTLDGSLDFVPGTCSQGMELLPTEDGVGFRIDVPGHLEVISDRVTIESQGERWERVRPWLSDREFGATAPGGRLPEPAQWLARFRAAGAEVAWRMHGGEARREPNDPTDYEGWYLQDSKGIAETSGGIFFFACRERDGELVLQLQRLGASDALWQCARRVIALLEPAEIWCGNCRFTTPEWRQHVADGSLPVALGSVTR